MTKEEREKAIENLEFCTAVGIRPSKETFKVALEALKQEPCEDAISRKAVIDIWHTSYSDNREENDEIQYKKIAFELPPVTPIREHGEWIRVDDTKCKCSKCEIIHFIAQYPHGKIDFCPNCGADMRKGKK